MKRTLQIGVTGGIGSGKSLVCRIFNTLGVPVYDADSRAKSVMTTDGILMEAIKKEFGTLSYKTDNVLDREFLAKAVFGNRQKLEKLNALVHPRVALDYSTWMSQQTAPYVLKEAALLIEAGTAGQLDALLSVQAPIELRIKRVLTRDPQRNESQVKEIMKNQLTDEERSKHAQHIIHNDEKHSLIAQVLTLHKLFSDQTN